MGHEQSAIAALCLFGILVCAGCSHIANTEESLGSLHKISWPMPRHDIGATARSSVRGPISPTLLWSLDLAEDRQIRLTAPVVLGDGSVLVGERPRLFSLRQDLPKSEYDYSWIDGVIHRVSTSGQSIAATYTGALIRGPVIGEADTVFAASYDRRLWALRPLAEGFVVNWVRPVFGRISTSPLLGPDPDGVVYVYTEGGRLHAFSKNDGQFLWMRETRKSVYGVSPVMMPNGLLAVGNDDDKLTVLDKHGAIMWERQVQGVLRSLSVSANDTLCAVASVPTGQALLANHGQLSVFTSAGELKWTYDSDYTLEAPAFFSDGSLCIGSRDAKLVRIASDGIVAWSIELNADLLLCAPVVDADDRAYFAVGTREESGVAEGLFETGGQSGSVTICCVAADASILWSRSFQGKLGISGIALGPARRLYAATAHGYLYAFGDE